MTRVVYAAGILFAMYGFVVFLHQLMPCEARYNCDSSVEYDAADAQW